MLAVGSNRRSPPLGSDEWVRGSLEETGRREHPLRPSAAHDACSTKVVNGVGRHAPDAKLGCELLAAGSARKPGALR